MRGTRSTLVVLALVAGCSSTPSDPARDAPPPARPRPSPEPASEPSPEAQGGIVIKGSKRPDAAPAPTSDGEADRAREARIAELSRKAADGNVTANWKDFLAPDGTFRILFPRVPDQKAETRRLADGSAMNVHSFSVVETKPDDRGFVVVCSDLPRALPPAQVEAFLAIVAEGTPKLLKGHILEARPITVDGNPGRETRFDYMNGKGVGRERIVLAGTRCYQFSVYAPTQEQDARDVERFLGSFKIVKAPVAGAPALAAPVPAANQAWVEFVAPDGSCRALFPQKPSASDFELKPRADGVRPVGHRVMALDSREGPRIFVVACADDVAPLPDDDARRVFLEQSMQAPFGGGKGTLTGGRPIQVGTAAGREATFRFDDGTVELDRCLFVGSRFYSVSARASKTDTNTSDVQKFLDSFQLLKK